MDSTSIASPLGTVLRALRRRKLLVLFVFASLMVAAVAVTLVVPKQYFSEAKLFVRLGRESVTLDPTATAGATTVSVIESREHELASVLDLLKSRALLEQVVDTIGAEKILSKDPAASEVPREQNESLWSELNPLHVYSLRDKAIERVGKKLSVHSEKKSSIITLNYRTDNPELAQQVLQAVVDTAMADHIRVNRTAGSKEFFEAQADQRKTRLRELEQQLRNLKTDSGLASLEQQRGILLEQIGELERSEQKAEATLKSAEAESRWLQAAIDSLPATLVASETTGLANEGFDGMREQLYAVQVIEKEMATRLTAEDPRMHNIQQQIADARAELQKEESTRTHRVTALNQTREELQLARHRREAVIAASKAEKDALSTQLLTARTQLDRFNAQEIQIADLQREIDLETANYRRYSEALEQTRIDRELANEWISNVNVLQQPTFSVTPVRPQKLLNLGAGFVFAVCTAVGLAVWIERPRATSTPPPSTDYVQLPILAKVPRFHHDMRHTHTNGSQV